MEIQLCTTNGYSRAHDDPRLNTEQKMAVIFENHVNWAQEEEEEVLFHCEEEFGQFDYISLFQNFMQSELSKLLIAGPQLC